MQETYGKQGFKGLATEHRWLSWWKTTIVLSCVMPEKFQFHKPGWEKNCCYCTFNQFQIKNIQRLKQYIRNWNQNRSIKTLAINFRGVAIKFLRIIYHKHNICEVQWWRRYWLRWVKKWMVNIIDIRSISSKFWIIWTII